MGNSRLPRRGRASITRTSTKCSQCSSTLARRTQSRTSASQLIVSWSEPEGRPVRYRGGHNAHVTASDESKDSNSPVHAGAQQAAQFVRAIFLAAPHDSYLEIRPLPVERGQNARRFLRILSCKDEVSSRRSRSTWMVRSKSTSASAPDRGKRVRHWMSQLLAVCGPISMTDGRPFLLAPEMQSSPMTHRYAMDDECEDQLRCSSALGGKGLPEWRIGHVKWCMRASSSLCVSRRLPGASPPPVQRSRFPVPAGPDTAARLPTRRAVRPGLHQSNGG